MFTKRKFSGAALYQYGIIICLIALAVVPVYFLLGNQIVAYLSKYNNTFSDINKAVNQNTSNAASLKAGGLAGTPANPVEKCDNSLCDIDFGDYILKGMPQNYSQFIETAGTAGATQNSLAKIEDIAKQMEDKGDTAGAQQLKDLANLGYFIAKFEKTIEDEAKGCQSDANPYGCFQSFYDINDKTFPASVTVPDNLKTILTSYTNSMDLANFKNGFIDFGSASSYVDRFGLNNSTVKELGAKKPSHAFVQKYQTFMNDNKNETAKKIITSLYDNIVSTGYDFNLSVNNAGGYKAGYTSSFRMNDPVTGKEFADMGGVNYDKEGTAILNDLITPKRGAVTDTNSKLICVTGKYQSYNNSCNK